MVNVNVPYAGLTWNKEHDPSSKRAVEPLKGREVGEGEDSCDDASKARHGREDHKSTSGVPVGWGGVQRRNGKGYKSTCMCIKIHLTAYFRLDKHPNPNVVPTLAFSSKHHCAEVQRGCGLLLEAQWLHYISFSWVVKGIWWLSVLGHERNLAAGSMKTTLFVCRYMNGSF